MSHPATRLWEFMEVIDEMIKYKAAEDASKLISQRAGGMYARKRLWDAACKEAKNCKGRAVTLNGSTVTVEVTVADVKKAVAARSCTG